ncbi:MAG: N-acetylmuramoyl-L-alanine amidase [Thermoanaerobaculia bacterium]
MKRVRVSYLAASLFLLFLSWLPIKASAIGNCPAIGQSPSCSVLITIVPDGSLVIQVDPQVPPYDGVEDELVGVVNNSGASVYGIALSGSDIFGFDGDGAGPGGNYNGPGNSFTVIDSDHGIVNFTGANGLAAGGFSWFSLEGAPSKAQFAKTIVIDAGHGFNCPAVGQEAGAKGDVNYPASNPPPGFLYEDVLTAVVTTKLAPMLQRSGYTVLATKADPNSCPTFLERGAIANKARANAFVSIHFNKVASFGCSFNPFDYCSGSLGLYNQVKSDAATLAQFLATGASGSLGIPNQQTQNRPGLALLKPNVVKATSAIIEVARLNEPDEDIVHATSGTQAAAAGIKQGIDVFFNH